MSKLKGYCRRFLACVMICFSLSFTFVGDYLGVQEFQVYATGLEIGVLEALIEAILASMGISLSSQADLSLVAQGLSSVMSKYTDYEIGGVKIFPLITEVLVNTTSSTTSWGLPAVCDQWLRQYLYTTCASNISTACDVTDPIFDVSDVEVIRGDFSYDFFMENDLFYGKDIYASGGTLEGNLITLNPKSSLYNSSVVTSVLTPCDGYAELAVFFVSSSYSKDDYFLRFINDNGHYKDCTQSYNLCDIDGIFNGALRMTSLLTYNYNSQSFSTSQYISSNGFLSFSAGSSSSTDSYYIPCASDTSTVRVFLSRDAKIYSSYADYNIQNYSAIYRPASRVYGLSSTARSFEKDEATDTVIVPFDSVGITSQVEQAVATAIAANPSITEEEINAAAADVIAAQNGTTDAVNQNTQTLGSLLTSILVAVRSIADNVSKISIDGGAGALDWSDVQDAFGTTTVEPDAGDNDSDNDNDGGKPNFWVPGIVAGVSVLLKPLIEFLGEPLSVITQFQSAILGQLDGAQEWIMDIPEAISVALNPALSDILEGVLSLPVTGIYEGILDLPGDIADALSNGLSVEVPDVTFPDLEVIDYTSLLDRIIELIESMFLLDTAAIAAALVGFEQVWEEKLPFGNKMLALFNGFNFSSNYSYPVIKIKTPDILSQFYPDEYIILCDFENYKKECLWARNIVKAWLWFCFGLSIFNHLKTNFHIG